ncbi:MAG TPA: cytosine permease [Nocardioidaceae bacterium]|nr:cytosine permease [Nocardioidaceae bacterium]
MASAEHRPRNAAEATEDWANDRVSMSNRHSTLSIVAARMGFTVSATDLLYGVALGLYFPFWTALLIALGSSIVISVVSILLGLMGQREGITTALCMRSTFGREGVRLPALAIAVISAGFAGYSTGITVNVLPGDSDLTNFLYCVGLGVIYTAICIIGFGRGLTWVGRIAVPLMLGMVLVATVAAVNHAGGWDGIVSGGPVQAGELTVVAMIGLGINKWMTGATVTPDVMRFGRTKSSVYTSTLAEFVVGNFGFNLLGIIVGLGVGIGDLGEAFAVIGVGGLAVAAVFVQGFPHEVNNMYAASLAGRTAAGLPRLYINIISGLIVIGVAYYGVSQGILDSFLGYLGWLGYVIPLIPGILIADYFLVRRRSYGADLDDMGAFNLRAVAAFAVGLGINLVLGLTLDDTLWRALPLLGFALYLLFSVPQLQKAWSRTDIAAPLPEEVPHRG